VSDSKHKQAGDGMASKIMSHVVNLGKKLAETFRLAHRLNVVIDGLRLAMKQSVSFAR